MWDNRTLNISLINPNLRELPHFKIFIFGTCDQELLRIDPLHLCDHIRVSLQDVNRLLCLNIKHCNNSRVVTCDYLPSRTISHTYKSNTRFTLKRCDWLCEFFPSRSTHIEQGYCAVKLANTHQVSSYL